jgi:hypothetical protein
MLKWALAVAGGTAVLLAVIMTWMNTQPGRGAEERQAPPKSGGEADPPFAVVELFTSEGCSSCPPADALLGELVEDARTRQRPVYCLAFHVDYWDGLGWRDPYSDAALSRRQQEYARALQSDRVYTPQMIVNGSAELVVSDRTRARERIDLALKQPARAAVKLAPEGKQDPNSVVLAYEVARAPRDGVLNVAVVERGLASQVRRGENGGRTLRHDNVVRAFRTIRLAEAEKGTVQLPLPADLVRKNSSAIAYVQDAAPGAVLGAAAVELEPADARR